MKITLTNINKSFNSNHILKDLNLSFEDGEFVTLLGPSGCGKTTTLRCVAGLEDPDEGSIVAGEQVFAESREGKFIPPHKRKIGMVFQSYALWPHMSVQANVAYPLKRRKLPNREIGALVNSTLAAVGMDAHSKRFPHELSGGQQQRVALARGLVSADGIMLFDEPLSNLDAKLRIAMRTEIRRLHDEFGHTSLYVTHDQEEALALSDRIVIMNGGQIEQSGTPEEIHSHPATRFAADFVGFDNILDCEKVVSTDGSAGRLHGAVNLLPNTAAAAARPGEAIAFRSNSVKLGLIDGAAVSGRGLIKGSTYMGEVWSATLETETGTKIRVEVPAGSEKYIGRNGDGVSVDFSVRAEDVALLGA